VRLFGRDGKRVIDGRPEAIHAICDESLRNLKTDRIDLYYLHRWDKRFRSRRASARWRISNGPERFAPSACRKWARDASQGARSASHRCAAVRVLAVDAQSRVAVLDECKRIGASLVAFSPLGRGFLAGECAARPS
jgi:aryl-alcohol dehydrogenase-like predicted oxidoreductase